MVEVIDEAVGGLFEGPVVGELVVGEVPGGEVGMWEAGRVCSEEEVGGVDEGLDFGFEVAEGAVGGDEAQSLGMGGG